MNLLPFYKLSLNSQFKALDQLRRKFPNSEDVNELLDLSNLRRNDNYIFLFSESSEELHMWDSE